eukprot:1660639-Rhodomonas_salina.1
MSEGSDTIEKEMERQEMEEKEKPLQQRERGWGREGRERSHDGTPPLTPSWETRTEMLRRGNE